MAIPTEEQRQAALAGAGLSSTQQQGVKDGTGYTGTPAESPTMADLFGSVPNAPSEDPTAASIYAGYKNDATAPLDPAEIRSKVTSGFQDRLDAIQQVFNQKKADMERRVGQENLGRTGQTTAILAARGLGGSARGMGINAQTDQYNRDVLSSEQSKVDAERQNALNAVYGAIDAQVNTELAAKAAAKAQGGAAYIEYLKDSGEKKQNYASSVAQNLYDNNIDPTTLANDAIAQLVKKGAALGLTKEDITSAYSLLKSSATAADAQAKQAQKNAIDKELAGKGYIFDPATGSYKNAITQEPVAIGEGGALVDPITGKVLYKNPKTFAPQAAVQPKVLSVTEAQALGLPYGTTEEEAMKKGLIPQRPLTEFQAKDIAYGNRAADANTTINNLENTIKNYNPQFFSATRWLEPGDTGNAVVPDEIRQIAQAERNFVTAVLRQESGAKIDQSEFATDAKKYFPRPGDDATTLAQKRQARETAIASFKAAAAGNAPGLAQPSSTPPPASTIRVKLKDGRTGSIDPSEFDPTSMTKI